MISFHGGEWWILFGSGEDEKQDGLAKQNVARSGRRALARRIDGRVHSWYIVSIILFPVV